MRLKNRINLQFLKHSLLDMKKDKAKTAFGIGGIAVSLFLLTAIGMLNDTMSYNYIKLVTNTTGAADIMVMKTVKTDLTYDMFFDQDILDNELADVEGVDELFPRIAMFSDVTSENINKTGSLQVYGLDFKKEHENGGLGELRLVDENGKETMEIYDGEPDDGECVILQNVAEVLNVSIGDTITMTYQQYTMDVEVVAICEQYLKFLQFETSLILLNLEQAQTFFNRENKINFIYGLIENPDEVYDSSNVDATTQRLRAIGTRIQERLDLNDYMVTLPKLEELENGEFLLMGTTIIFWFITILSMLITAILINSILSTSIEERVREFGVLRVVGGRKVFPVKMVLFEGFFLGMAGSVLGIVLGFFFTVPIADAVLSVTSFGFESTNLEYIIHPNTILLAFSIGSGVALIVSLIPALRTAKLDLIKAITPFQTKEEGWEITKEGSMNVRSFLIGISIATIGLIIFVLLPRIFVTGDIMLIVGVFIGLLAAILIGLVFASVGIIPLIQRVFLGIISPAIRKYSNIIKITLKRYRRRNTSTVVMFAISFSFIFYITSLTEMEADNMELNFKFQYGSDLVLSNQGNDASNGVTLEMLEDIKKMEGVDEVFYALHNTFDLTAALSMFTGLAEGGSGFDEDSTEAQLTSLLGYYSSQWQQKYEVRAADVANHDSSSCSMIGVDEEFVEGVDEDMVIWSSPGSSDESFDKMLEGNKTCIIAKALATAVGIEDVGETIRLTFYNPQIEDDPGNVTLFTVVGISGGIPGFFNFRSSEFSASVGGVMVSMDTYVNYMDVANPMSKNMVVDKIFINLANKTEAFIEEFKEEVSTMYPDTDYVLDDALSKIIFMEEMNNQQSLIMEIILMFTVMICIFGLISSMYAVMLERKFEIGILRSMGLKARNVRNMFLIEAMIIMLSAGVMGTLIGSYSAYLMETNLGLLTEMPVIYSIPMDTLLRVFILSISIGIVAMWFILLKLSRQNIMEIFRQTF